MSSKIKDLKMNLKTASITAAVTMKSELRAFKSGKGKLFEIELFDGESVRMVFFNELADKFFNVIEVSCPSYYSYFDL